MKHMNLKRVFRRVREELVSTYRVAKMTSWRGALSTLVAKADIQIMNHNGYKESERTKKHLMKKHEIMLDYFEQIFSGFEQQYNYDEAKTMSVPQRKECLWMCWWQGLEHAPDIVKKCVESVKKYAGTHEVIVITEDNYMDYVTFPQWIVEMRNNGIISRTHYSDLLRLELLATYGGIWLDATFFCVKPEIEQYFKHALWTVKRPNYGHTSVACGNFATYSFGCNLQNRWIFAVIRDFVLQYWKTNDLMIDYLFLDYIIVFLQRHNKEIAKAFDDIKPNNPLCDELFKVLGKEYDALKWNELKKDTMLFKLTWKQSYAMKKNGKINFYGALMEDILYND